MAWVDNDKKTELGPYLSGRPPGPTETVKVTYPSPQRAELEASLESPGLVILADVYYPGWELTIDGKPAPIYPVNRLMRGRGRPGGDSSSGLLLRTPIVPGRPNWLDPGIGRPDPSAARPARFGPSTRRWPGRIGRRPTSVGLSTNHNRTMTIHS